MNTKQQALDIITEYVSIHYNITLVGFKVDSFSLFYTVPTANCGHNSKTKISFKHSSVNQHGLILLQCTLPVIKMFFVCTNVILVLCMYVPDKKYKITVLDAIPL